MLSRSIRFVITHSGFFLAEKCRSQNSTLRKWDRTTHLLWKAETGQRRKKLVGIIYGRGAQKPRRKIWGAQSSRLLSLTPKRSTTPTPNRTKITARNPISRLPLSLFHSTSPAPCTYVLHSQWAEVDWIGRTAHSLQSPRNANTECAHMIGIRSADSSTARMKEEYATRVWPNSA